MTNGSNRAHAALVGLIAGLLGVVAGAQVVGAILTGTVADPGGASVPNATVTIQNVGTRVVTVTRANAAGIYSAANLLPGEYTISADAPGLTSGELPRLTLTVGENQILNIQLKIPTVTQTLDVLGGAATVELGSAAVSHVVDGRKARELPLNGRDWTQLAILEPGISPIRTQPDANGLNNRGNRGFGSQLTIAGGRPQQNNYRLDGVSVNDYANSSPGATSGLSLGAEAIAEFSVISSNYPASCPALRKGLGRS
jgi:carboxypeptidase family protein